MANTVSSLFPELAGALAANPLADAYKPVSDPLAAYTGLISGAGAELRQSIGQAFGQQTPQEQLRSIVQSVQEQADLTTPEGLLQLANEMNKNPQFSGMALSMRQEAAKLAREQGLYQAEVFKRTAQGAKALQEKAPPTVKTPEDFAAVANELGFGVKPSLADYTAAQTKAVNEKLKKDKLERVKAGVAPQSPTEKQILKGKADTFANIETSALQATKTSKTADAIDSVLNRAFVGFGSDAVLKASQVAEAFGVTVSGTSETEQLKQLLAQLAQGQAKSLPGSLSEKELAFLREAIGTPGFTLNTLRSVVKRLREDALTAEIENNFVQQYVADGNDLNRYNFVQKRKEAQALATKQIAERDAKIKRIQELEARKAQQGRGQ